MGKVLFKKSTGSRQTWGEEGGIRQAILLVLLIFTAGLGYLYFFTGVIKPREHVTSAPQQNVAPVKQPLPPRTGQETAGQASTQQPPQEENKAVPNPAGAAATPAEVARPADNQTEKKTTAPASSPPAQPASKPAAKPPATVPPPAPPAKKIATPEKRPAAPPVPSKAEKIGKPEVSHSGKALVKPKETTPSASHPAKRTGKSEAARSVTTAAKKQDKKKVSAPGAPQGRYAIVIGGLANGKESENIRARLEKDGIKVSGVKKVRKSEMMHRLLLAEFDSQEAAGDELARLKANSRGAFMLKENGKFSVYAGSYLHLRGAETEMKRLKGKGFKLKIKTIVVAIPVDEVTAGEFSDIVAARKEAESLKKKGISASVVKIGD